MKTIIFIASLLSFVYSSDDGYFLGKTGVKPVDNQLYIKECASCHFGYQPGLLSEKSWNIVMNNLADHFGTDASLEKEDFDAIYKYIMENSANKAMEYKRSAKMANSIASTNQPIDAITKVPYFIKEHREIPKRLIVQEEVKSLSNCIACHTTANKGYYGERSIKIPNYGRWDD